MKKALIFTLYGNINYGNKLQNIAVQKILEENGIDAYTVVMDNPNTSIKYKVKRCIKYMIPKYRDLIKKQKSREESFLKFDSLIKKIKIKDININEFDYIIVGSDQVWNPNDLLSQQIVSEVNRINGKKIISVAGSIAALDIEEKDIEKYAFHFNRINNLSVREENGKEIIKKITNRNDITVVLDPTMIIRTEEWLKMMNKPKQLDSFKGKKFILNYFLGTMSNDRKKEIEKIAIKNDCHIINILDPNDPFFTCGPSEFLYLEKHAFLINTDSFHSSVFAILFNKPFIVYNREDNANNMSSRLDTLINKLELKNRRYNEKEITKENMEYDYTSVYEKIEKERKIFNNFLEESLSNDE